MAIIPPAIDGAVPGPWLSPAEAAAELGLPEQAIYGRVASRTRRAGREKRSTLLVRLEPSTEISSEILTDELSAPQLDPPLPESAGVLVTALLARQAEQGAIIREQAEELGRLRARAETSDRTRQRLASSLARQLADLSATRDKLKRLAISRRWWRAQPKH